MRQFPAELKFQQSIPTDLCVDNTSAIKLAHNPEFHQRSKHIDDRFHFTRNLIESNAIRVCYIQTNEQPADILTKPLFKTKHGEMRAIIDVGCLEDMTSREGYSGRRRKTRDLQRRPGSLSHGNFRPS
jgi:hypothetical protein